MSCRYILRSKGSEAVNASTSGRRPLLKRLRIKFAGFAPEAWLREIGFIAHGELRPRRRMLRAESSRMARAAVAAARRTTHRAVGMDDVDVHFVHTPGTMPRSDSRHQLRLHFRRPELDDLAQGSLLPTTLPAVTTRARDGAQPSPRQTDEALGIGLIVATRLLEAAHGGII